MTQLNIADWIFDVETRCLNNTKLKKEQVLTEAQSNILISLIDDPGSTIDINDLASIGWPKDKVSNTQIASCISDLNKMLCGTVKIEFSEDDGACLVLALSAESDGVQDQDNDETEKSVNNDDSVNALDMKTIFAAIVIVGITAAIMIYS